jgi:hypothetical protein
LKKNILGAFTLALLVLMGTGVAFGHWQDWVYINGCVNTGTMDVVPSYDGSRFDEFNYKSYNNFTGVAYDDVYIEESTLFINLYNVYPGVCWYGTFNVENVGTVPAGFVNMTGSVTDSLRLAPTDSAWEWNVFYTDTFGYENPDPVAVISVTPTQYDPGPEGSNLCQIDPGYPVWFNVQICFKNPLPQSESFHFEMTLEFWNWNEVTNCPLDRTFAVVG